MCSQVSKRVLVICMLDSIHSARWLHQFKNEKIEFLLIPSSPHRRIHPDVNRLLKNDGKAEYRIDPIGKWLGLPLWVADKFVDNYLRATLAKAHIRSFRPDIVHALELQNAGYIALKAMEKTRPMSSVLMTTNWGSDIYWFQHFPKHREKLSKLMKISDYYSAECHRDLQLARNLGFTGTFMPVIPNAGGLSDRDLCRPLIPGRLRKTIAIKGYDGWVGRAKIALEAISGMANELVDYELILYSTNLTTKLKAIEVKRKTGLPIVIHPKGALTHSQVLDIFARSIIYIGLSESDGISTSLLEAMAMGAIPVQTSTACCDEWFSDSGVKVEDITPSAVQNAIRLAMELAKNDLNAKRNLDVVRQKAASGTVSAIARKFYDL